MNLTTIKREGSPAASSTAVVPAGNPLRLIQADPARFLQVFNGAAEFSEDDVELIRRSVRYINTKDPETQQWMKERIADLQQIVSLVQRQTEVSQSIEEQEAQQEALQKSRQQLETQRQELERARTTETQRHQEKASEAQAELTQAQQAVARTDWTLRVTRYAEWGQHGLSASVPLAGMYHYLQNCSDSTLTYCTLQGTINPSVWWTVGAGLGTSIASYKALEYTALYRQALQQRNAAEQKAQTEQERHDQKVQNLDSQSQELTESERANGNKIESVEKDLSELHQQSRRCNSLMDTIRKGIMADSAKRQLKILSSCPKMPADVADNVGQQAMLTLLNDMVAAVGGKPLLALDGTASDTPRIEKDGDVSD